MDYSLPDAIRVETDGPVRIVKLARPEQLNAVNGDLHLGLTRVFPQLSADQGAQRSSPGKVAHSRRAATSTSSSGW
jgi:hypothetical protein